MQDDVTIYDRVFYPGQPYRYTHPDRMASIATLYGLDPAHSERCRVLELGCGDGSNLIPMASELPGSEFVGVDLAGSAVAKGRVIISALGLRNITLGQLDLLEFPSDRGLFDYIVAHGIYSWVPPAVRDTVLAICRAHLTPHGVACVSYNTQPAGHLRTMIREMMLFHAGTFQDPGERIAQAEAFLAFLAGSRTEADTYGALLQEELDRIRQRDPAVWFHDDLSDVNHPVYFTHFVERARAFGLQYLADADPGATGAHRLSPAAKAWLAPHLEDGRRVEREQVVDFLVCRGFRRSLICREEHALGRPTASQVPRFYLTGHITRSSPASDIRSDEPMTFSTPTGTQISTNIPLPKATLTALGELWPEAVAFEDLLAIVGAQVPVNTNEGERVPQRTALCDLVWESYEAGIVNLLVGQPRLVRTPGDYPEASALARFQARSQTTVTNLLHTSVRMDESARQFVVLLDGTRDRAALKKELRILAAVGDAPALRAGAKEDASEDTNGDLAERLEEQLSRLGKAALLVR